MIERLLKDNFGIDMLKADKSKVGAGSDTYFITAADGKYVMKFPSVSEMNNPEAEPELCSFLLSKGLPVCEFLRNKSGGFISEDDKGRQFHLQKFVEGKMYALNEAPEAIMDESAEMLGKIHTALLDYKPLGGGIGAGFFKYMTPENAAVSYNNSLETAKRKGNADIEADLLYRLELMEHFPDYKIDVSRLTNRNTHGDYFISQLICGENKINAVIDWTTACVHPVVWEIFRSFVYGSESAANGEIDADCLIRYVRHYFKYAPLNAYDIKMLVRVFYYQISVCDYYAQYYASTAANRGIYLNQALFSTKLMKWLEKNEESLTERLISELK